MIETRRRCRIHGYLAEFEEALSMVLEHLEEEDTKLILLGNYVHRGPDGRGVMERIMELRHRLFYLLLIWMIIFSSFFKQLEIA